VDRVFLAQFFSVFDGPIKLGLFTSKSVAEAVVRQRVADQVKYIKENYDPTELGDPGGCVEEWPLNKILDVNDYRFWDR